MRSEAELLCDMLGRLNTAEVAYMLTGSMASNYWGIPRTTHDLDFVLALVPEEVDRLIRAFEGPFFFQPTSIRAAFRPPRQFNLLDELSALKADFWILGDDPFEKTAFARRLRIVFWDIPTWIATPEDIILHKLYWSRLTSSDRQLGDAAGVWAVQADTLDLVYLRRWAEYLQVTPILADLLEGKLRPKTT